MRNIKKSETFKMALGFWSILLLFLLTGCRTLDNKIRDTVAPAGEPLGAVQAVPEGLAQGYVADDLKNPYGR